MSTITTTQVKYAARLRAGDVLVLRRTGRQPVSLSVQRVERARGRKPAKGETLILHVGKRYPVRVNSTEPVRVAVQRASA